MFSIDLCHSGKKTDNFPHKNVHEVLNICNVCNKSIVLKTSNTKRHNSEFNKLIELSTTS